MKEGVKKVFSFSARIDSWEELKKALENEFATNIKDGKTLKVREKEFVKSWNEEFEAQNTIPYPFHTTRTALHRLNRVSCEGFERLRTDQKTEFVPSTTSCRRLSRKSS